MTAAELIEELESLSPADVEQEIQELEERIVLFRRVLKMIKPAGDAPAKERKPRPPKKPPDTSGLTFVERAVAAIRVSGPLGWRELMQASGLAPAQLAEAIEDGPIQKNAQGKYELE